MNWDTLRRQVYKRDNYTCRWCGAKGTVHADHIVPRSQGGADELGNLQTLCGECHARKHGFAAHTFWLLVAGLRQLGVPFGDRDRDSGAWSFNAKALKGLRLRMKYVDVNISGFEATKLLPVARLDRDGKVVSALADGFYEALLPAFETWCVENTA